MNHDEERRHHAHRSVEELIPPQTPQTPVDPDEDQDAFDWDHADFSYTDPGCTDDEVPTRQTGTTSRVTRASRTIPHASAQHHTAHQRVDSAPHRHAGSTSHRHAGSTPYWDTGTETQDPGTPARSPKKEKKKSHRFGCAVLLTLAILVAAGGAFAAWLFGGGYAPHIDSPSGGGVPAVEGGTGTRRAGAYNFLIVGIDRASNSADVIMLAQLDTEADTVSVLQIPRDTFIDPGRNFYRINAYFASEYNRAVGEGRENPYQDAIEGFRTMLTENFGVTVDRYLCMDTEGFRAVIDSIGGVDLDVPFDMHYEDPAQNLYIHLSAGMQHLDGDRAEQFVRFRKAYLTGDIGRISAQKLFLTAVLKQVKNNLTLTTAVNTAKTVLNYLTTDVTPLDAAYFAEKAYNIPFSSVSFVTLPGAAAQSPTSGAWYYILHRENAAELVGRMLYLGDPGDSERPAFDPEGFFDDATTAYIHEIYQTPYNAEENDGLTAGEIEENSITIPHS